MTFKTKMRFNKGSMTTVIPSAIVKMLDLEHGKKLNWTAELVDNNVVVMVEALKETE